MESRSGSEVSNSVSRPLAHFYRDFATHKTAGEKRPSWRTASVQYRRLGLIILRDQGRRPTFEGGYATGAKDFGRHEPDESFAALALNAGALAPDMLKE
jgi:hypothetical protein